MKVWLENHLESRSTALTSASLAERGAAKSRALITPLKPLGSRILQTTSVTRVAWGEFFSSTREAGALWMLDAPAEEYWKTRAMMAHRWDGA